MTDKKKDKPREVGTTKFILTIDPEKGTSELRQRTPFLGMDFETRSMRDKKKRIKAERRAKREKRKKK